MNTKEIGELRRRFKKERSNIKAVYGCYVNDSGEIISQFRESISIMPENETEKYLSLFKKTLGGTLGKHSINLSFPTMSVAGHELRHNRLMELRKSELQNEDQRKALYQAIIDSLSLETNYVILLGCDTYDVPFKSKDDAAQADASEECFTYIICAVCPVKETKPNLHYIHAESTFHDGGMIQAISSPILGFTFPAFNNRSTDIYGALYYCKDTKDNHADLIDAVFGTKFPDAADEQKEQFNNILSSQLNEECDLDIIRSLHEQAEEKAMLHKESKIPDILTFSCSDITAMLQGAGASEENVQHFANAFTEAFGEDADVPADNILDMKHHAITLPDAVVHVTKEGLSGVRVQTIEGVEYLLIPTDSNVEFNGIPVNSP